MKEKSKKNVNFSDLIFYIFNKKEIPEEKNNNKEMEKNCDERKVILFLNLLFTLF